MPAGLDDAWPAHVLQGRQDGGHGGHGGREGGSDDGRPSHEAAHAACDDASASPADRVGGLLDGLVHDFARGADVLAWRLVDPGPTVGVGPGGESGCAPADLLSGGAAGDWPLPMSLDLRDLLGGGREGGGAGLLDGLDLESALQRALSDGGQGAPDGGEDRGGREGGSRDTGGCEPVARCEAGTAAGGAGCAGDDATAAEAGPGQVSHDLGWSAGSGCQSPLAGLLEPARSHGEGC